jgi:phosphatidylserine/phosphatidylglycerophosphate/cardiolipin synthase-like enzyme
LHFDLRDNGTAKIDHRRKGVTEFLKPFVDLVPDEKRSGITPGVGCAPIGSPEFRARCEELGNSPIRANNSAELLVDGIASMPKRLELINGAKKSIYMQTMVFKDDQAGLEIADALCAAAARGVDVKVIIDALGNATSFSEVIMMNPIYGRLREGGVQLELHNNSIGEGTMEILGAISRSEKLSEIFTLDGLSNPKKIFSNLHIFAKGALGQFDLGLTETETKQLATGITLVLGGKKTDQSLDRVRDLVRITQDNKLELSAILEFIRHNAHLNHRWHEKYLIVDGEAAVVGGINSADEYLAGGTGLIVTVGDKTSEAWRDTDVFLKGEAVRDALHHFADNYKQLTGKELLIEDAGLNRHYGDYQVQMVHSRPHIDSRCAILDLAVECLGSLQKGEKAYFENAYFVPSGRTQAFEDALIAAAKRGADVRVLMNSETSMDVKEVAHSAVFSQRRMLEGGVRVFERTGERMMHSKVGVFGSKVAAIGSWNADNRASSQNNESSAFVHDARIANQVENMIENDMKEGVAREIHLDEISYLPLNSELRNASKAILSDLL